MTKQPTTFDAGRPRFSVPIRWIARPLGPLARPIAGRRWFPFYAVLHHVGRSSGKPYATPVVALRAPDGFLVPLPFGDATQWAKNLFAAGAGSLTFAGREHRVVDPTIIDRGDARAHLPAFVRFLATRLGLRQFVLVRDVAA